MKPLDYILIAVIAIIIGVSLFFTIKRARNGNGCGCGCRDCPMKRKKSAKKDESCDNCNGKSIK